MDRHLPTASDVASRNLIGWIRDSVISVHLGMDVSFDIFILVSVTLFGISMLRHPKFGAKFGFPGCVAAVATLGLNLHSFPSPARARPVAGCGAVARCRVVADAAVRQSVAAAAHIAYALLRRLPGPVA